MKFEDLVISTPSIITRIKEEYIFYPTGGIDFNKVLEPIEDINDCIVSFDMDYLINEINLFITSPSGYIRSKAYNYENHKEIMDEVLKKYLKIYKPLDNHYKSLSDEEKLKLELED